MKHKSGAHFVCQCFREYKEWKVFVHDTYRWERKVEFQSSTLVKELLDYFFLNLISNAFMVGYFDCKDSRSIFIKLNTLIYEIPN